MPELLTHLGRRTHLQNHGKIQGRSQIQGLSCRPSLQQRIFPRLETDSGRRLLLPHFFFVPIHHVGVFLSCNSPASDALKQNQAFHALVTFLFDEVIKPTRSSCTTTTRRPYKYYFSNRTRKWLGLLPQYQMIILIFAASQRLYRVGRVW